MEVDSVLVTGANRGIGLEFVKQLVKLPKPPRYIFATYRDEKTLQDLQTIRDANKEIQVVLIKMDVTKQDDIESARKILERHLEDRGLNLLINNAGCLRRQGFLEMTTENMLDHFTTNTVGPVMIVLEMLPLLQKSAARTTNGMNVSRAAVLNISSLGGSISLIVDQMPSNLLDDILSYRTSKAALNMAMRVIAAVIKDKGILVVNLCPGSVKTRMGIENSQLTTEESVSSILLTLAKLDESYHGTFFDRNGKTFSN